MKIAVAGETLLARAQSHAIRAHGDEVVDVRDCDLCLVAQDVDGPQDMDALNKMMEEVTKKLLPNIPLVINSQVPPGYTRTWKRKYLYYQVDTLITHCAFERAQFPERFIVGAQEAVLREACEEDLHPNYYEFLSAFDCQILMMSYESAELAKLAINFYLASSITVANVCEEIAKEIGADWNDIIPALKSDKRIGRDAYLNPGVPGGHLTRDLLRIQALAKNKDFINAILRGQ